MRRSALLVALALPHGEQAVDEAAEDLSTILINGNPRIVFPDGERLGTLVLLAYFKEETRKGTGTMCLVAFKATPFPKKGKGCHWATGNPQNSQL